MELSFTVDFKDVAKQLAVEFPRQVNFAMAKTLTALAKDGADAVVKQMPVVFKGPTGFTLKAPAFEKATPQSQQSRVYLKNSEDAAGKSVNEHLRPGALGSPARHQKKTEYLLTQLGDLPPGWVTVPGKAMPLDANGNMPGQYYRQVVRGLQLKVNTRYASGKAISKASQARAKRMQVASEIFCVTPGKNTLAKGGGWIPPGVYQHLPGRKLRQMLKFVRKATYQPLLNIDKIVGDTVIANAEKRWAESVDFALKTAKP